MSRTDEWAKFFTERSTPDDFDEPSFVDDPADGAAWLLELVSVVELRRLDGRADFTTWHALEEALRCWTIERTGMTSDDDIDVAASADPLGDALLQFCGALDLDPPVDAVLALQQALRRWCTAARGE